MRNKKVKNMVKVKRKRKPIKKPKKPLAKKMAIAGIGGLAALGVLGKTGARVVPPPVARVRVVMPAKEIEEKTEVKEKETAPAFRSYTVERSDSLWKIAQQFYGRGERWIDIWRINRGQIAEPDLIFPGQELLIPSERMPKDVRLGTVPQEFPQQRKVAPEESTALAQLQTRVVKHASHLTDSLEKLSKVASETSIALAQKESVPAEITQKVTQIQNSVSEAKIFASTVSSATSKVELIDATVGLLDTTQDALNTAKLETYLGREIATAPTATTSSTQITPEGPAVEKVSSEEVKVASSIVAATVMDSLIISQSVGQTIAAGEASIPTEAEVINAAAAQITADIIVSTTSPTSLVAETPSLVRTQPETLPTLPKVNIAVANANASATAAVIAIEVDGPGSPNAKREAANAAIASAVAAGTGLVAKESGDGAGADAANSAATAAAAAAAAADPSLSVAAPTAGSDMNITGITIATPLGVISISQDTQAIGISPVPTEQGMIDMVTISPVEVAGLANSFAITAKGLAAANPDVANMVQTVAQHAANSQTAAAKGNFFGAVMALRAAFSALNAMATTLNVPGTTIAGLNSTLSNAVASGTLSLTQAQSVQQGLDNGTISQTQAALAASLGPQGILGGLHGPMGQNFSATVAVALGATNFGRVSGGEEAESAEATPTETAPPSEISETGLGVPGHPSVPGEEGNIGPVGGETGPGTGAPAGEGVGSGTSTGEGDAAGAVSGPAAATGEGPAGGGSGDSGSGDSGSGDGGSGPGSAGDGVGSIFIMKATSQATGLPLGVITEPVKQMADALNQQHPGASDLVVPEYRMRASTLIETIARRPDWQQVYQWIAQNIGDPVRKAMAKGDIGGAAQAFRTGFETAERRYLGTGTHPPDPNAPRPAHVGADGLMSQWAAQEAIRQAKKFRGLPYEVGGNGSI